MRSWVPNSTNVVRLTFLIGGVMAGVAARST